MRITVSFDGYGAAEMGLFGKTFCADNILIFNSFGDVDDCLGLICNYTLDQLLKLSWTHFFIASKNIMHCSIENWLHK